MDYENKVMLIKISVYFITLSKLLATGIKYLE